MRRLSRGLRGRLVHRPAAGPARPLHQRIPRHVALPHRPLVEPVHRGHLAVPRRARDPRAARILAPPLLERRPILGCGVPPRRPIAAQRQEVEPLPQVVGDRRLRVLRTRPWLAAGEIPDRSRLRQPALGEEDPPSQDRHAALYPTLRSGRPQRFVSSASSSVGGQTRRHLARSPTAAPAAGSPARRVTAGRPS